MGHFFWLYFGAVHRITTFGNLWSICGTSQTGRQGGLYFFPLGVPPRGVIAKVCANYPRQRKPVKKIVTWNTVFFCCHRCVLHLFSRFPGFPFMTWFNYWKRCQDNSDGILCRQKAFRTCRVCGKWVCRGHRIGSSHWFRCLSCSAFELSAIRQIYQRQQRAEKKAALKELDFPCATCGVLMRPKYSRTFETWYFVQECHCLPAAKQEKANNSEPA